MPSLLTASGRSFTTREAPLLVPLYDQRFGPWQIAGDGSFVCGAAKTADISIQQASIQQQHCRFDYQDGRLTVVRLEGRVWVNEVPLHGDALLEPDDVISLGSWTMRVLTSDPLRPAVSSDDGSMRRAVLLGAAGPSVIFTGGTDRRFRDAFPRVSGESPAVERQRGYSPADAVSDVAAARVSQLLEREAEISRREQRLKAEELRLAELLAELEQARADLTHEQQQHEQAAQTMAEAVAIRLDAESMRQSLQRERQELTELTEQQQQQRAQLTQALALQQQVSLQAQQQVQQRQAELETRQAELNSQQQLLADRHQSLQARETSLDDRARRIQQASMARSTLDASQLHQVTRQEARAAELAERELELAERVAAVCGWRRRQAVFLTAKQAELDAVGHDLRQQKSALRLRSRELDAQVAANEQKVAAASVQSSVWQRRESELQTELREAQQQQQLLSQQLTAALTTCEQLRNSSKSLQEFQSTVRERDQQLLELQQQLHAVTASVAERDILIQDLHQQLLTVLAERRDEQGSLNKIQPEPAEENQIWRHPDEESELFSPLTPSENAASPASEVTTEASLPDSLAPEKQTETAEATLPSNESLLQSLPPGVLHQELLRLLQLSQPAPAKMPPNESPSANVAKNEDLTSANIVPLLDEGTVRMLEQSDPEVRLHVERMLAEQRRTDDETKDMAAPKPTIMSRRMQSRGTGRQETGEAAPQPRPPISYIEAYNNGSLSLTSDQAAFETAAEAADRMAEKAEPQETLAEEHPPVTSRTADELVRYVRRTNTNATINQSLQQLRRLSAEASQTAITKHALRRHRKGFLVRTTAIVAGMVAVVWGPPWLLLWTKNPQLAIWGPLAVFAATCLELIRKLVVVLRLERKKLVEPIAKPRPAVLRPELPAPGMDAEAEIEDQHPLL